MDRDFAAERAALRQEAEDNAAKTRQLEWDLIKHLYGVECGSLVRDFKGHMWKITGLDSFAWYPTRTPAGSGLPGFLYDLPDPHIRPSFFGVHKLRNGGFGEAEHHIYVWTKIEADDPEAEAA